MDEKKAYWFEQPYMPQMKNIAVAPVILEGGTSGTGKMAFYLSTWLDILIELSSLLRRNSW